MRFAIVGTQSNGLSEVLLCIRRHAQIIPHVSAVHVARRHVGLSIQGARESVNGCPIVAIMCVNVACNQGQVMIFGQTRLKSLHNRHGIVIAIQKKEVICQVDRSLGVMWKLFDNGVAQLRRLFVVPGDGEIAFMLAHDFGVGKLGRGRAVEPLLGERSLMRFQGGVHRPRDD